MEGRERAYGGRRSGVPGENGLAVASPSTSSLVTPPDRATTVEGSAHPAPTILLLASSRAHAPAAILDPGPPEGWRAIFAYDLLPQPVSDPALLLARQAHILGYWLALPADLRWAVQLRVDAVPRAGGATLAVGLVGAAGGATRTAARRGAGELAAALALGLSFLGSAYRAVPVLDSERLGTIVRAVADRDLVEIGPRRDALPTAPQLPGVPLPLPDHAGLLHWLCGALVAEATRVGRALSWIVTLEGAPDLGLARDALAAHEARHHAALHTLGHGRPGPGDGLVATLREADALVDSGGRLGALRWALTGLAGRAQAFLTAEGGAVPPAVVAAAIAELSDTGAAGPEGLWAPAVAERPARPRERAAARRALAEVRCVEWQTAAHPPGYDQGRDLTPPLAHLADARAAAHLWRLPIPGSGGLPGLPLAATTREVWLHHVPARAAGAIQLGDNVGDGRRQPVWLGPDDRRRHTYIIGQTGVGKSSLLLGLIAQDLDAGRGMAVLDFHGDLIEAVLGLVPDERAAEVVLVDPADLERPVGFNFLEGGPEDGDLLAESFIGLMYQLFDPLHQGIVGPRFEHAVRNAIHTALAGDGLTLVEVVRILTDPAFVRELLPRVGDPLVRRYWLDQVAATSDFHKSEVLDYVTSKFGRFVTDRRVRNIIGQSRSTFSLRETMDAGNILLINLSAGRLGSQTAAFLGNILMPRLLHAAFSRAALPEAARRDFAIYCDEFHNFATPAFVDFLAGARKYRVSVTMAHQHIGQLPTDVRDAIFGNVGTMLAMRVGLQDAAALATALQPSTFEPSDFLALPNFRAIAQTLAEGRRGAAFSLATLPPPPGVPGRAALVRARATRRYGRPRQEVEAEIARRARL